MKEDELRTLLKQKSPYFFHHCILSLDIDELVEFFYFIKELNPQYVRPSFYTRMNKRSCFEYLIKRFESAEFRDRLGEKGNILMNLLSQFKFTSEQLKQIASPASKEAMRYYLNSLPNNWAVFKALDNHIFLKKFFNHTNEPSFFTDHLRQRKKKLLSTLHLHQKSSFFSTHQPILAMNPKQQKINDYPFTFYILFLLFITTTIIAYAYQTQRYDHGPRP